MRRLDEVLARLHARAGDGGAEETAGERACPLPAEHHCSGGWHWQEDGGAGTAYERCPRSVEGRRAAAAAEVPGDQTFETFDAIREPDAYQAARRWAAACAAGPAKLVLLRADATPHNTGCGKTHLLRAAARELARAGRQVALATAWDLAAAVRGRGRWDAAERSAAELSARRWIASEILLLDDLGQEETAAPLTASFLIGVLDGREGRSLAAASNLTAAELTLRYGAALVSRLLGGALVPALQGRDYRRRRWLKGPGGPEGPP